ncbi:MAG TPA: hypothetical protein VFS50_13135 [Meiothermus sp.]|nr:hypothetical protein [Meiothermus sp.]
MKGLLRKPYLLVALWVLGFSMSPGLPVLRPTAGPTPRATVWRPQPRSSNPPSLREWLLPDPMGLETYSTPVYSSRPQPHHPRHIA